MSTRAAIRPRPLDINKQLLIVKDVSELDSSDALAITAEASNHFSEVCLAVVVMYFINCRR
jgi:hypothetical protein